MKKIMFSIIALAGMISVASCKKELQEIKQEEQVSPETVQLSITASIPESKTLIAIENNAYVPKWVNGDILGVFIGNFDANATAVSAELSGTTNDGGETATFKGSAPQAMGPNTVYAFYPARAFYATEADNVVDLEIPYIQFPTEQSFDPKADLLVSVPQTIDIVNGDNTIDDMQFRRIGAILKVDLADGTSLLGSDKIKSVKLESKAGTALTGAFCYDFTKEDAASTQITAAKNHVTADFSLNPVTWGTSVYFIVNPTTLASGTELVVTVLTDNHRVEKTIPLSGDMVFESSTVKKIRVTFNDASAVERVYFQDNFDWLYKYMDVAYGNAYEKSQKITDPVANDAASHDQPNIWSKYSSSIGAAFTSMGYNDLGQTNNTLYMQENYVKIGAGGKQTALRLPQIEFGETPVNVMLSFKWCRHMTGTGNIDTVPLVVEVLNQGKCADSKTTTSNEFTTVQAKNSLLWTNASVILIGVTNSTEIVIKENYETYTESGNHRFHLDDIIVTDVKAQEGDILWQERWNGSVTNNINASDYPTTTSSTTVFCDGTVNYTSFKGNGDGNTRTYNDYTIYISNYHSTEWEGDVLPENPWNLMIGKANGWFKVAGIPCANVKKARLTFLVNINGAEYYTADSPTQGVTFNSRTQTTSKSGWVSQDKDTHEKNSTYKNIYTVSYVIDFENSGLSYFDIQFDNSNPTGNVRAAEMKVEVLEVY